MTPSRSSLLLVTALAGGCSAGPDRAPTPEQPFRAFGNEPGWSLVVDGSGLALTTRYGERRVHVPDVRERREGEARVYRTEAEGAALVVTVTPALCVDTMTGMPRPATVIVVWGEERLKGCGGDPAALLAGEWRVVAIGETAPIGNSQPSLRFDPDGHLSGNASCNRLAGSYALTGEGLRLGPLATTMMACSEELMDQEHRLLEALEGVDAFAIAANGELELRGADHTRIVAHREG